MSSAPHSTRVVCAEIAPRIADLEANREITTDTISRAAEGGADVIVLPELATSGYMLRDADEARPVAVRRSSTLFDDWAAAAGRATVVGGFCELGDDGLLFNSAAVVDATGLRAVYRKTHLWDREADLFHPGDDPPPVLDTPHGRLGVLVCYDLEFPEMTRTMALRGADLLAVPVNWPRVPRPDGERPPEVVIAMAAARVNRLAIACCDRTGEERGQTWTAGTTIIDAHGWVAATPNHGGLAVADLDLVSSRDKRLSSRNDALGDRRPELYT